MVAEMGPTTSAEGGVPEASSIDEGLGGSIDSENVVSQQKSDENHSR